MSSCLLLQCGNDEYETLVLPSVQALKLVCLSLQAFGNAHHLWHTQHTGTTLILQLMHHHSQELQLPHPSLVGDTSKGLMQEASLTEAGFQGFIWHQPLSCSNHSYTLLNGDMRHRNRYGWASRCWLKTVNYCGSRFQCKTAVELILFVYYSIFR